MGALKTGLTDLTPDRKVVHDLVTKRAEELGFDSYWIGEPLAKNGSTFNPGVGSVRYPGVRHDRCELVDLAMITNPKVSGIGATPRARP